mgnify:CR=1 FL=1
METTPIKTNEKRLADYSRRIKDGREKARKLNVVFCGLARDCSPHLYNTLSAMAHIGKLFRQWGAVVYENDSRDSTLSILRDWQSRWPRIVIKTDSLNDPKWSMARSPDRGTAMARYRNTCRNIVLEQFSTTDAVIVLDLDLSRYSVNGILHTFSFYGGFDVMASNGLRRDGAHYVQYDAWAFRKNSWEPMKFKDVKNWVYPLGSPLIPVRSAFGGLAVYQMNAYKAAEYGGGDCEHVIFHRKLYDKGYNRVFINPSQKVIVPSLPPEALRWFSKMWRILVAMKGSSHRRNN